jgi:hypothetical protein
MVGYEGFGIRFPVVFSCPNAVVKSEGVRPRCWGMGAESFGTVNRERIELCVEKSGVGR